MNVSRHDVIWESPSSDAAGSMPLGNGRLAANLWCEPNGDVRAYLARSDAWAEMGNLLKLGRFRARLRRENGQPLLSVDEFRQHLHLEDGLITIHGSDSLLTVWIDAHHPSLHFRCRSDVGFRMDVSLEPWRTDVREPGEYEKEQQCLSSSLRMMPDVIVEDFPNALCWYHRNESSSWAANLRQQHLEEFAEDHPDPLLHRTFGGMIAGDRLVKLSPTHLAVDAPVRQASFSVTTLTARTADPAKWLETMADIRRNIPSAEDDEALSRHRRWWRDFWRRSYLLIDGPDIAREVSRGYQLQRYLSACAGRGAYPIKFNGSLFSVDWHVPGEDFDADYRRWGPGYWHQNTRLAYWPMLATGDFEMLLPYFRMYRDMLPLARFRTRKYFGHEGAYFPETVYFWGAFLERNYGHPEQRTGLSIGETVNRYIRWHYSSGLELVYHACLYFSYTWDQEFAAEILLPLADGVLEYYDKHFSRGPDGLLRITPAQCIEQWHEAINPLPELAGLRRCLEALLTLPEERTGEERRGFWRRFASEIPELPTRTDKDGLGIFAPAEEVTGPPKNSENPELYGVFPYHLHTLSRGELDTARRTFHRREYTHDTGWAQDGIQAALLGLTAEARQSVEKRLTTPSEYARFPAFWGPGFDWIPDQSQGGSAATALQFMLMQCEGKAIRLLPAWPREWSASFRFFAPENTVLEGEVKDGNITSLHVTPESRNQDVIRIHP
ncbi:MAG: hypothetical protein JXA11_02945 [Phycisphaerae bacterium]|nr:hypothetical protein [Phycisphaerae bacterium]